MRSQTHLSLMLRRRILKASLFSSSASSSNGAGSRGGAGGGQRYVSKFHNSPFTRPLHNMKKRERVPPIRSTDYCNNNVVEGRHIHISCSRIIGMRQ